MIESVVALLMFVNGSINEARITRINGYTVYVVSARRRDNIQKVYPINVYTGSAELETNIDGSFSVKKLILE